METTDIALIAGIGNPGAQYAETRHNAGWWFLDRLVGRFEFELSPEKRFKGYFGEFRWEGKRIRVIAPSVFMNRSGETIAPCAAYYRIDPSRILIAHDELDLDPGDARLKVGGGHGGHNGLRDIGMRLGSLDFPRLRIGIGHPNSSGQVTGYVLSRPPAAERLLIDRAIDKAMDTLLLVLSGEMERAMHLLHTKDGTALQQE